MHVDAWLAVLINLGTVAGAYLTGKRQRRERSDAAFVDGYDTLSKNLLDALQKANARLDVCERDRVNLWQELAALRGRVDGLMPSGSPAADPA